MPRNVSWKSPRTCGLTMPAPNPCTRRATITVVASSASAAANPATANSTSPSMYRNRRPSRSPSRPAPTSASPNASEYEEVSHCTCAASASRERWMLGTAKLNTAWSRRVVKAVATPRASTSPLARLDVEWTAGAAKPAAPSTFEDAAGSVTDAWEMSTPRAGDPRGSPRRRRCAHPAGPSGRGWRRTGRSRWRG